MLFFLAISMKNIGLQYARYQSKNWISEDSISTFQCGSKTAKYKVHKNVVYVDVLKNTKKTNSQEAKQVLHYSTACSRI